MPDEILPVAEVALLLKVAEKTVHAMAQKAELPCFTARGQWRFRRQNLDTWMAVQVAGAGGPGEAAPKSPAKNADADERSGHLSEVRRAEAAGGRRNEPHSLTKSKSFTDGCLHRHRK